MLTKRESAAKKPPGDDSLAPTSERGSASAILRTFMALLVVLLGICMGVKCVPVMINAYAFRDFLEEEARYAPMRKSDDEAKARILRKARELELPVSAKAIQYEKTSSRIDIKVKYTIPIETPVYTYQWNFDESVDLPIF